MDRPSPEAEFERWRDARDLDALAAVFDAVAPKLLRVASHLVRDAAAAEDLVQTTFLEVLRHPHRYSRGRPLQPWLLGILTRQAGKVRRIAARRIDPARAPRRDEPPPERQVADAELDGEVQSALAKLQEPYASVLRACLLDGARPIDLAAQRGCAPATVRMQLSRGLTMLRRLLPIGLAVPLVVERAAALERLRETTLRHASTLLPTTTLSLLGLTLVQKHLLLLIPVAAGVFAWTMIRPQSAPPQPAGEPRAASAMQSPLPAPEPSSSTVDAPTADSPTRAEVPGTATGGLWLVGSVHTPHDAPAGAAVVEVSAWGERHLARVEAAPDGTYSIDLLPFVAQPPTADDGTSTRHREAPLPDGRRLLQIRASRPFCLPEVASLPIPEAEPATTRAPRRELRQDFDLRMAAIVSGMVTGPHASMHGYTKIALFTPSALRANFVEPVAVVHPDAAGRFEIAIGNDDDVELWVHNPRTRPALRRAHVTLGQRTEVGTIPLDDPAVSVRGRLDLPPELRNNVLVVARREVPPGADRVVSCFENLARVDGALVDTIREAWSDASGAFAIDGVTAGNWQIAVDSIPLWPQLPHDEALRIEAPANDVVLAGDRLAMQFAIHDATGPVPNCTVHLAANGEASSASTGTDGTVQWLGRREPTYRFTVDDVRFEPLTIDVPGAELAVAPYRCQLQARPTASLELTVTEAVASQERHVRICLFDHHDGATAPIERQATLAGKPLRFDQLPAGTFRLRVQPEPTTMVPFAFAGAPTATVETEVELRAGETARARVVRGAVGRLRIDTTLPGDPREWLRCEISTAAGAPIATRTVVEHTDGWSESTGRLACRGRNAITPDLAPGEYVVVVAHAALGELRRTVTIEADRTTTLRLGP